MMKTFYNLIFVFAVSVLNAQILYQENFESLNLGPIVGQRNYTIDEGNAVVTEDGSSKVLSLSGSSYGVVELDTGNFAGWQTRNPDNNIIQVEYDYYTGPNPSRGSLGGVELIVDNEEYVGFLMNMETKSLYLAYHYWGIPIQQVTLGVKLPANSWVRLGFAYNTSTLLVTFKGPGFTKVFTTWGKPLFQNVGLAYWKVNNELAEHIFDNVVVKAVAQESLLGVNDSFNPSSVIEIYPNPATSLLNVSSKEKILWAYIYDWAGIRTEVKVSDGTIDVKNLPVGSYILGIKTENGFTTKKFIKK